MKNISFKRNESVLKGLEIQSNGNKKNINWDRYIYFVILGIVLIIILKYAINSIFYVDGNGQVRFENISISNIDDSRVIKIFVHEGDEVKAGDSLFTYILDKDDANGGVSSGTAFKGMKTQQGDVSWSEKETFKVNESLKVNNLLISEKVKLKNILSEDLQRIKNEVMLDVLPRYKLDDQINKINQLTSDIQALRGKNAMLSASLAELSTMKRDLSSTVKTVGGIGGYGGGSESTLKVFYAPISGTITTVMKNEFEVAFRGEEIMSIHKPQNISIRGFFNQEDLASLKVGDRVDLEFPDGTQGRGIIRRFYFATYRLPEEFQKKYEPTTRSLTVDIYPESTKELSKWKAYWKMAVLISKSKY